MNLIIDDHSTVPPYEQLRQQLRMLILGNHLAEAEHLPSVRRLAADLGLANGTVARAYRELEAENLVSTTRKGTAVSRASKGAAVDVIEEAAGAFAQVARLVGLDDHSAVAAVTRALAAVPGSSRPRSERNPRRSVDPVHQKASGP